MYVKQQTSRRNCFWRWWCWNFQQYLSSNCSTVLSLFHIYIGIIELSMFANSGICYRHIFYSSWLQDQSKFAERACTGETTCVLLCLLIKWRHFNLYIILRVCFVWKLSRTMKSNFEMVYKVTLCWRVLFTCIAFSLHVQSTGVRKYILVHSYSIYIHTPIVKLFDLVIKYSGIEWGLTFLGHGWTRIW